MSSLRQRWEERYTSGSTPWDTGTTPPEIEAFWQSGHLDRSGLALDVGCGPGTNVRYLARIGLTAVGVDIALTPLLTGYERLHRQEPELIGHAFLVQADITQLPLWTASASYILDVGCSHGLPPELRPAYAAGIIENLRPGGYYHLYAFDHVALDDGDDEGRHMGMNDTEIVDRFTPALEVVEIVRARPDRFPCRWYLLRKPSN